jgi:hypothetical protein
MKYLISLLCSVFFLNVVSAQEKHFVFIETENRQPFYVSLNGKVYSSSSAGYLIIPKLSEGEYNVGIGFAGNNLPEQGLLFTIGQKDLGFTLKNMGEKGWALFNLQTLALTIAGETKPSSVAIANSQPKEEYKPEISFDRKKDTAAAAQPKPEEVVTSGSTAPAPNKDSAAAASTASTSIAGTQQPSGIPPSPSSVEQKPEAGPANMGVPTNSTVKKVAEVKGDMGVYITYVDADDKTKDTVQLIIPTDGTRKKDSKEKVATSTPAVSKRKEKKSKSEGDLQFLNLEADREKKDPVPAPVATVETTSSTVISSPSPIVNSNCTNAASESDYNKLRRKMALQTTEEAKMKEARKVFKNKCFTTSQIKGLSTLFLSDAERYKFFDVSYNVVTDVQLYSSLENELIDPYYITRFKAMLRK